MIKIIKRKIDMKEEEMYPEYKLVIAIIGVAVTDLRNRTHRQSAIEFFDQELFRTYCTLIGLNPETTKQLLVQGGFLDA